MNGSRRGGLFGFLVVIVIALVVGGIAYTAGLSAGQTALVAPGVVPGGVPGTVVYAPGWHGFGFGFGIFGFLFLFLLIGLLFRAFGGGGRRSWGGPGGWGGPGWDRSRWASGDVPPPMNDMLVAWHRRAHGDAPAGQDRPQS